jgi:signal transduction histidine kinase
MKTTIEMFLCLARETDDGLYNEHFLVLPVVNQAVGQQRYLLSGKSIDVDIDQLAETRVCGHPQAFSIAVTNLVRNAFEHALDGQGAIMILIKEHELLVSNQVSSDADGRHTPTEPPSNGYGLGLGIVQRLCERNGWSFSLHMDEARVTARLSW